MNKESKEIQELIEELTKKIDEILERLDKPRYVKKHISEGKKPSQASKRD